LRFLVHSVVAQSVFLAGCLPKDLTRSFCLSSRDEHHSFLHIIIHSINFVCWHPLIIRFLCKKGTESCSYLSSALYCLSGLYSLQFILGCVVCVLLWGFVCWIIIFRYFHLLFSRWGSFAEAFVPEFSELQRILPFDSQRQPVEFVKVFNSFSVDTARWIICL
jgi:hypothetical protein